MYLSREGECDDLEEIDGDDDSLALSDQTTCAPCVIASISRLSFLSAQKVKAWIFALARVA